MSLSGRWGEPSANQFRSSLWGCAAGLEFPGYAAQDEVLEKDANPFATVVQAHLKTLQTRQDPEGRGSGSCGWCGACTSAARQLVRFDRSLPLNTAHPSCHHNKDRSYLFLPCQAPLMIAKSGHRRGLLVLPSHGAGAVNFS